MSPKLTINAVVFLLLTVFAVTVAVIFQNPLLVYTAVFLSTTNIMLFCWALLAVRGIRIRRSIAGLGVAGQPLTVQIALTNEHGATRFGTVGFDVHSALTPGTDYSPVAFMVAPPHETVTATYTIMPPRRGVFRVGPFYIYGGDPFGFYKCWYRMDLPGEVTVLPATLQFRMRQPGSTSNLARDELATTPRSGASQEFLGVREYVQGEPRRSIHWRTSARLGKLISRQYEQNVASSISVLLLADQALLSGGGAHSPLEYAITLTASLGGATAATRFSLSYLALGLGMPESLRQGAMPHDSHAGTGRRFHQELLIRLARLSAAGPLDWEQARRLIVSYLPARSSLVVLTASDDAQSWARLSQLSHRFSDTTVVQFAGGSFERGKAGRATASNGSAQAGLRVIRAGYGDDLSGVLAGLFGGAVERPQRVAAAAPARSGKEGA